MCGLNPYAGEDGLIGTEEERIIKPAIKKFLRSKAAQKSMCFGPSVF